MVQREIKLNRLSERMSLKFLPEFAGRESLLCSVLFKRKSEGKVLQRLNLSALTLSQWKMLISAQRIPCTKN